jgi:hypothetical protein
MNLEGAELALVRAAFRGIASVREVKMFGGTAFMVNGHMTVAVSPRGLLVRVGPDEHKQALEQPGTRAMQMRGRVVMGFIFVDPAPSDTRAVHSWVQRALRHNRTLPPKNIAGHVSDAPPKKRTVTKRGTRR